MYVSTSGQPRKETLHMSFCFSILWEFQPTRSLRMVCGNSPMLVAPCCPFYLTLPWSFHLLVISIFLCALNTLYSYSRESGLCVCWHPNKFLEWWLCSCLWVFKWNTPSSRAHCREAAQFPLILRINQPDSESEGVSIPRPIISGYEKNNIVHLDPNLEHRLRLSDIALAQQGFATWLAV